MSTIPELTVPNLPLQGLQLIEASAGTGKTWTIAMLYLRLVLGPHPGATAPARPLLPRDILVVTFTDAATQELRARIRQRLAEGAEVFADPERDVPAWDERRQPIAELRAHYPRAHWPALAQRLRLAADAMDDAAISTLHGWCQRVLREQAFASGEPFVLTLQPDRSDLIDEALADLWRLHYRTLPPDAAATVAQWWTDPEALGHDVHRALRGADHWHAVDPGLVQRSVPDLLAEGVAARRAALAVWKARLAPELASARPLLETHGLLAHFGRARDVQRWLDTLANWAAAPEDDNPPPLSKTAWERLNASHLQAKAGDALPAAVEQHPLWDTLAQLPSALAALPTPRGRLLRHAAVWVQRRVADAMAQQQWIDFDGLLQRVAGALDGPTGAALAERLRARHPVALVDEFQDTDPVQLRILERIYGLDTPHPDTALILIGDPKQSIYAFRHADIHSYLRARRARAATLWRLGTNHRSSHALVAAVNHLFARAEQASPVGAFRFGRDGDNPVPFIAVAARGREACWCAGPARAEAPALTLALLPTPDGKAWTQEALRDAMAAACADRVVGWLRGGAEGPYGFAGPGEGDWRPVQPQDIAILVNDRHEADAIGRALRRRGVGSVYLSERQSVYASGEAADLQVWLAACAQPPAGDAVRAALATRSLGLTAEELEAWLHDDTRWEEALARFGRYHMLWHRHGVLPAVRALLHDFDVPQRLRRGGGDAENGGERALTNLLHLAELLQQAGAQDGSGARDPARVLQHLRHARARVARGAPADGGDSGTPVLRLESERHRVRLITVHKSKGLQYPLVLYPFAMHARPVEKSRSTLLTWHDADGALHVTLDDEGERWQAAQAAAEAERWAEDVRRLYVALTRAEYGVWVGVAATPHLAVSALGHLLGIADVPKEGLDDALAAAVQALAQGQPAIAIERLAPDTAAATAPAGVTGATARSAVAAPAAHAGTEAARDTSSPDTPPLAGTGHARRMPPRNTPSWWIASYSALLAKEEAPADPEAPAGAPELPDSARDDQWTEDAVTTDSSETGADVVATLTVSTATAAWHHFPRGPATGTALHAVLETCARTGWPTSADALQAVAQRALTEQGWASARLGADATDLATWVQAIGDAPLPLAANGTVAREAPSAAITLARLTVVQPEWEFWLSSAALDSRTLDAWVCDAIAPGVPRPPLRPTMLHGMLKGYIDLVFEHGGRYHVLDHKSNALGPGDADYHADALQRALLAHRYDVQGVLYLVALHRLLRQRLPGYRPHAHLGALLLGFWRGVASPTRGVLALPAPVALIERLDAALAGSSVSAVAEEQRV